MIQGLAAILASFGFAVLFNIRGDKLISASFIGGSGGVCYCVLLEQGSSQAYALFIASVLIAILSELFARWMKCPVTTFLLCALIPLVPGGGMYYTMLEVVNDNINGAISMGVETLIQACSIVLGCTFASSGMRMFYAIKRKIKQ